MSYSIIKEADHEFVVRSEEQDVLICTSRRQAARTIADANDLLKAPAPERSSARNARTEPKSADETTTI